MLHLYYGPGKGKTTAALGLLLRAYGHGLKVAYFGLMKGAGYYGEVEALTALAVEKYFLGKSCPYAGLIKIALKSCPVYPGCNLCHVNLQNPSPDDKKLFFEGFTWVRDKINSTNYQVVILDELALAAKIGLISEQDLKSFIEELKKEGMEVIITGRETPEYLKAYAEYITYFTEEKHPFRDLGITSRKGVEF